ncbi:MAG TPA: DUF72 domain-containing protein [Caulobacteraceae bacterium]|jgi:uncharacterized protein YecE (DUF72 family)|nr:DUF72 domain-containing protein [Caulobacteraceae bacterium]
MAKGRRITGMENMPHVGVGGWSFEPWCGVFYPKGLRHADELAFASRALTSLEINATYHKLQTPQSFAAWAAATPEDFVFSIKASRFCTNRKVLAQAGEAITRFFDQGLVALGPRLGPILWQFMPTKTFDPDDFARFLDLLPPRWGGAALRHCVEPRHESFQDPRFAALCAERGVAVCLSDHDEHPLIAAASPFVYARLMRLEEACDTGYPRAALAAWASRLEALAGADRDLFVYFIGSGGEGKVRAPAAARALLAQLGVERAPPVDLPRRKSVKL